MSMGYRQTIDVLHGGDVMAECGPMRLVISSFVGKVPQPEMNIQAAKKSFEFLEQVAGEKERLGRTCMGIPQDLAKPLPLEMVRSVLAVGDADLTPMAAVAGTIADAVADYLAGRGMTRVIVNNGGDVALRLQGEDSATVGIREDIGTHDFSHVIVLGPERFSWGVATSGLGGRSLTRGIASASTVIASTASLADAAATAVANASFVKDPRVIQRDADRIDPATDIPGVPVTLEVGTLARETKSLALRQALDKATGLTERGIILGAFVAVDGKTGMTEFFRRCLKKGTPDEKEDVSRKP
jgi:hypothetical protein